MTTTEKKVKEIIADQLGYDPEDFDRSSNLESDLGADSLDFVEIVMAIEEEFDIEIDDGDAEGMKTVADVMDLVSKALEK